jgi:hypothetical protein
MLPGEGGAYAAVRQSLSLTPLPQSVKARAAGGQWLAAGGRVRRAAKRLMTVEGAAPSAPPDLAAGCQAASRKPPAFV